MKIKKSIIIITIILGLITTVLFVSFLGTLKKAAINEGELIEVVVADGDIQANVKITQEMVRIEEIPKRSVRSGSYDEVKDVVGQITKSEIIDGEQIISERMALDQKGTGLSYLIPENMRAMTIAINETSGVAGYINTGDKVDIIISYQSNDNTTSYTQFQNVLVLKKGINPSGGVDGEYNNTGLTSSLTLLVTPGQAEVLTFASISGSINLTLRNPADGTVVPGSEYGTANFDAWRER